MIEISKAASSEIKRMQKVSDRADTKLRLGLASGGCNELYYTLELVNSIEPADVTYEINGICVAIGSQDLAHLNRLKLDYSEDLMGGGFRFQNPQATSVCGCGNSFSLASAPVARWQLPT